VARRITSGMSGYQAYFATIAKADAKKWADGKPAREAAELAREERRIAIQPQLDELSAELDRLALNGGSVTQINEVGSRIDALLASVK
jgi:hypothetical protein